MSQPRLLLNRILPWLLPAGAVAVWFFPELNESLILERTAASGGEAWRWLTFPLVHLSRSHLLVNVTVVASLLFAGRSPLNRMPVWIWFALIVGPGAGALIVEPTLQRLAGLSALNVGLALWMGLEWIRTGSKRIGWWCVGATFAKLAVEAAGGGGLTRYDHAEIRTCPSCHLVAAAIALFGWWFARRQPDLSDTDREHPRRHNHSSIRCSSASVL